MERGGQAGFLSGPGFQPVFERFVRDWQNPKTGFFGVTYLLEGGQQIRRCDLSLTFHMGRYVPHLVRRWPTLIETLLGMKDKSYPQGWLENGKMTDHSNYDASSSFIAAGLGCGRINGGGQAKALARCWNGALQNRLAPEGK